MRRVRGHELSRRASNQQDLSHGGSFLRRFVEALHYYSALFNVLEDGMGTDSVERHTVEQQLLGCEIRNIVAGGARGGAGGGVGGGAGCVAAGRQR